MTNNIRELRESRKLSQEQFAKLMDVSRQTISSLENGHYNPSIVLAFKIARYFEQPIESIFSYTEEA